MWFRILWMLNLKLQSRPTFSYSGYIKQHCTNNYSYLWVIQLKINYLENLFIDLRSLYFENLVDYYADITVTTSRSTSVNCGKNRHRGSLFIKLILTFRPSVHMQKYNSAQFAASEQFYLPTTNTIGFATMVSVQLSCTVVKVLAKSVLMDHTIQHC